MLFLLLIKNICVRREKDGRRYLLLVWVIFRVPDRRCADRTDPAGSWREDRKEETGSCRIFILYCRFFYLGTVSVASMLYWIYRSHTCSSKEKRTGCHKNPCFRTAALRPVMDRRCEAGGMSLVSAGECRKSAGMPVAWGKWSISQAESAGFQVIKYANCAKLLDKVIWILYNNQARVQNTGVFQQV